MSSKSSESSWVSGDIELGLLLELSHGELDEFVIEGVQTTIPLHRKLVYDAEFQSGEYTIKWLEEWLEKDNLKD